MEDISYRGKNPPAPPLPTPARRVTVSEVHQLVSELEDSFYRYVAEAELRTEKLTEAVEQLCKLALQQHQRLVMLEELVGIREVPESCN